MVIRNKYQEGSALVITLLGLILMLVLIVTINKLVLTYQRSSANYVDSVLAENYAKAALLAAESTVLTFDTNAALENPPGTGGYTTVRHAILANGSYNIESYGATCNFAHGNSVVGWCYQSLGAVGNYAQNPSLLPWLITNSSSSAPCNSYTPGSTNLPLLDDRNSRYSILYNTGDGSLCTQPRYILEPINLDYRGRFESDGTFIYGRLTQPTAVDVNLYQQTKSSGTVLVNSARLYRITARAFGKSGDTRVTVQEYLAIRRPASSNYTQQIVPLAIYWLK